MVYSERISRLLCARSERRPALVSITWWWGSPSCLRASLQDFCGIASARPRHFGLVPGWPRWPSYSSQHSRGGTDVLVKFFPAPRPEKPRDVSALPSDDGRGLERGRDPARSTIG